MTDRRSFLGQTFTAASMLAIRSLASGIPAAVLLDPRKAESQSADTRAQFLILNTSESGDPFNCNAPGTYLDPNIVHPSDPRMAKTTMTIGGRPYDAAAPWALLGSQAKAPGLFERTAFIHHRTDTLQHLHEPDVLGLFGKVRQKDMAVSAFAERLHPRLETVQPQPVTIGPNGSAEAIFYQGRPQPLLNPKALSDVLGKGNGPLASLETLRDRDLDRLHAYYKKSGNRAQKRFLDDYASSRSQTRTLSVDLLQKLASIADNGADSQVRAAVILIQLRIAPVMTVHIPFGGDNHFDGALEQESNQTVAGMNTLVTLVNELADAGLSDKVTFASINVFGRTLKMQGAGRNHNRDHHLTLLFGKNVRGGVIGGVAPLGDDYGALPIDSETGDGTEGGDITREESLVSVGRTLGLALGLTREDMDEIVVQPSSGEPVGKVIERVLT